MNLSSSLQDNRKIPSESIIVLLKCDRDNPNFHDIYVNKNSFKVGRGRDCDDHILNALISRNHCIFTLDNNQWSITNLSSVGIKVNGIPLQKDCTQFIDIGDLVQFNNDCETFKFFVKHFLEDQPENKAKVEGAIFEEEIAKQKLFAAEQEQKQKELEEQLNFQQKKQEELKLRLEEVLKNYQEAEGKTEMQNELIKFLEEKIKSGNEIEKHLQQNYEHLRYTVEAQKTNFEKLLNEERIKFQQTLDMTKQEKEELEKKMIMDVESWRQKQHTEWSKVLDQVVKREKGIRRNLASEKEILEEKLRETERALEEKTALAEQLKTSVQNEQLVILEIAANEELVTIDLTKDEENLGSTSAIKDINAVANCVENMMDETLTCQICSDLFVKAVTLNCSHSFCQYCIRTWMKTKCECPICRSRILSINKSIVLDNLIEKMVDDFTPQNKEIRKQLVHEREVAACAVGLNHPHVINVRRRRSPYSRRSN